MSQMSAKQRKFLAKKVVERRKVEEYSLGGETPVSWRGLCRELSGTPLVFVEKDAVETLAGNGLDEMCGGRPMSEYVHRGSLEEYVDTYVASNRRVLIVRNLAQVPRAVQLAAAVLGARAQEQLLMPGLRFASMAQHTFACTDEFARKNKEVVRVLRAAERRDVVLRQRATVTLLRLEAFATAARSRAAGNRTILYGSASDPALGTMSSALEKFARTFEEFMRQFTRQM